MLYRFAFQRVLKLVNHRIRTIVSISRRADFTPATPDAPHPENEDFLHHYKIIKVCAEIYGGKCERKRFLVIS